MYCQAKIETSFQHRLNIASHKKCLSLPLCYYDMHCIAITFARTSSDKVYEYDGAICEIPGKGGAYVAFPWDVKEEFGKGRVKVHATFDGIPYGGFCNIFFSGDHQKVFQNSKLHNVICTSSDKTVQELSHKEDVLSGEIAIGCGETKSMLFLSEQIRKFRQEYPLVQIQNLFLPIYPIFLSAACG